MSRLDPNAKHAALMEAAKTAPYGYKHAAHDAVRDSMTRMLKAWRRARRKRNREAV